MIKNDRQYRLTKVQAEKFHQALTDLRCRPQDGSHPLMRQVQEDALLSQLEELREEIREYEALISGTVQVFEVNSLEELPQTLIRARISQGLSQKDLAERLGLREQQIQRYEATDYASANLERIQEVITALSLRVREEVFSPAASISLHSVVRRLKAIGLDKDFLLKRLVPSSLAAYLEQEDGLENETAVQKIAAYLQRIFGWSLADLVASRPLTLDGGLAGATRFKMPAHADVKRVSAYTAYAYYLATVLLEATPHSQSRAVPQDPVEVYEAIYRQYGRVTFDAALSYVWDLGIPVLPLNDAGVFHGACWRIRGRNVIVLKQKTKSSARMLFDLLHELRHAAESPDQDELSIIELPETSPERRQSLDEQTASYFAGQVALKGQAEELAQRCVTKAQGKMEWLKKAAQEVAKDADVPVDSLANYLAFRVSLSGDNWWGAAHNLQATTEDPWSTARNVLLQQVDLSRVEHHDLQIFIQALSPTEV